jgi:hypothetical protein
MDIFIAFIGCNYEDSGLRVDLLDPPNGIDAVSVRQLQIHQCDVGAQPFELCDGLADSTGFSTNMVRRLSLEDRTETGARDGVIVNDQNGGHGHSANLFAVTEAASGSVAHRRRPEAILLPCGVLDKYKTSDPILWSVVTTEAGSLGLPRSAEVQKACSSVLKVPVKEAGRGPEMLIGRGRDSDRDSIWALPNTDSGRALDEIFAVSLADVAPSAPYLWQCYMNKKYPNSVFSAENGHEPLRLAIHLKEICFKAAH